MNWPTRTKILLGGSFWRTESFSLYLSLLDPIIPVMREDFCNLSSCELMTVDIISVLQPSGLGLMIGHPVSSGHWFGGGLSPHVSH